MSVQRQRQRSSADQGRREIPGPRIRAATAPRKFTFNCLRATTTPPRFRTDGSTADFRFSSASARARFDLAAHKAKLNVGPNASLSRLPVDLLGSAVIVCPFRLWVHSRPRPTYWCSDPCARRLAPGAPFPALKAWRSTTRHPSQRRLGKTSCGKATSCSTAQKDKRRYAWQKSVTAPTISPQDRCHASKSDASASPLLFFLIFLFFCLSLQKLA